MKSTIYLDNNATTAIDPRILPAMTKAWTDGPMNPSSQHTLGRRAQALLEDALSTIGHLIGSRLDQPGGARLILTSGGTESNNLALRGIGGDGPIVVSRIEHPSVLATAQAMAAGKRAAKGATGMGRDVRWLEVDDQGVIQIDQLKSLIQQGGETATLVSIMSANNETGVIQPVMQAAKICRVAGVPLHVDATQTIGKQVFHTGELGVSAVTFSAHKFHGPVGIGALWIDAGVEVEAMLRGGEQQLDTRPGTQSVPLAVGMAQALKLACDEMSASRDHTLGLRDRIEAVLMAAHPSLVVQGHKVDRLPITSCLSLPGIDRQPLLMALDMAGIACSSGAACSSGSSPPSHVLIAMNRPEAEVKSAIRLGVSKFSTMQGIDAAMESATRVYRRLCSKSDVDNS